MKRVIVLTILLAALCVVAVGDITPGPQWSDQPMSAEAWVALMTPEPPVGPVGAVP